MPSTLYDVRRSWSLSESGSARMEPTGSTPITVMCGSFSLSLRLMPARGQSGMNGVAVGVAQEGGSVSHSLPRKEEGKQASASIHASMHPSIHPSSPVSVPPVPAETTR